jgi:hypothetical protein
MVVVACDGDGGGCVSHYGPRVFAVVFVGPDSFVPCFFTLAFSLPFPLSYRLYCVRIGAQILFDLPAIALLALMSATAFRAPHLIATGHYHLAQSDDLTGAARARVYRHFALWLGNLLAIVGGTSVGCEFAKIAVSND